MYVCWSLVGLSPVTQTTTAIILNPIPYTDTMYTVGKTQQKHSSSPTLARSTTEKKSPKRITHHTHHTHSSGGGSRCRHTHTKRRPPHTHARTHTQQHNTITRHTRCGLLEQKDSGGFARCRPILRQLHIRPSRYPHTHLRRSRHLHTHRQKETNTHLDVSTRQSEPLGNMPLHTCRKVPWML